MPNVGDLIPFGMGEFFGDGSDGVLDTTESITFPVTIHTGLVVKQYESIKINSEHTVTVDNPCRGLVLYSQGNVIIDGAINMNQKASVGNVDMLPFLIAKDVKCFKLATSLQVLTGGLGGNGGSGGGSNFPSTNTGGAGGIGTLRPGLGGLGGGGGGGRATAQNAFGHIWNADGGVGGTPVLGVGYSSWSGRTSAYGYTSTGDYGGALNNGNDGLGGCGASGGISILFSGNPSAVSASSGSGGIGLGGGGGGSGAIVGYGVQNGNSASGGNGQYAGGFLLILSKKSIIINGSITANGGMGGYGSSGSGSAYQSQGAGGGGGGGGAGGGVIALYYKDEFVNNGTLTVNGGIGGSGGSGFNGGSTGQPGTSGSVGTIHIEQI